MPATDLAKTTVYLQRGSYERLRRLAEAAGRPAAEMVREAVEEYVARGERRIGLPKSLGAGRSGLRDLGRRAEKYLAGFGRDR
jgi:hypothetical protein